MAACVLCGQALESGGKTVVPTARGRDTINKASEERGDTVFVSEGQSVHEDCRRNYTNKYNIQSYLRKKRNATDSAACITQSLQSQKQCFDFEKCCLFCSQEAQIDVRSGSKVHAVRTLDLENTISKVCSARGDDWANTVKSRLEFVADLPSADAIYHQTCSLLFRNKKRLSTVASDKDVKQRKLGRPKDEKKAVAFEKVASFLRDSRDRKKGLSTVSSDNAKDQITVNDLIKKNGRTERR